MNIPAGIDIYHLLNRHSRFNCNRSISLETNNSDYKYYQNENDPDSIFDGSGTFSGTAG